MPSTVITKMNDRLDIICYEYYGSTSKRQVEIVLDSNPDLEKQPILLAAGLKIILPDIVSTSNTPVGKTIKLFS